MEIYEDARPGSRVNTRAACAGLPRAETGGGILYGWLLVAIFIEYARPSNQLTFLEFPFFYSIVPLTLLLASLAAPGLRPIKDVFADRLAKWVLIFFGITFVSFVVNGFSAASFEVVRSVLGYVFLFILIARIATTEKRIKGVIVALVLAHLYLLAMNFNVLTDPTTRQYLVGGTFLGDGNDYSLSLCILFPCMIGIALGRPQRLPEVAGMGWGSGHRDGDHRDAVAWRDARHRGDPGVPVAAQFQEAGYGDRHRDGRGDRVALRTVAVLPAHEHRQQHDHRRFRPGTARCLGRRHRHGRARIRCWGSAPATSARAGARRRIRPTCWRWPNWESPDSSVRWYSCLET